MDVEVTIKYTLKNFCDENDLNGKTLWQLFREIVYGEEYIKLFADKIRISSIKIKKDG